MIKLTRTALVAIIALLVFAACGGGNTPTDVAKSYLEATSKGEWEEAEKYCTEDSKTILNMMKGAGKPKDGEVKSFEVTGETIAEDGNTATVTYKQEGDDKEKKVNLKKVDDEWKVALVKEGAGS